MVILDIYCLAIPKVNIILFQMFYFFFGRFEQSCTKEFYLLVISFTYVAVGYCVLYGTYATLSPFFPILFQACCFETVGFDEYGEHVHSTIYPHLMTNVPKESMEYPDYTFQQHSEKPMPSYVDAKTIRDYLEGL